MYEIRYAIPAATRLRGEPIMMRTINKLVCMADPTSLLQNLI